MKRPFVSLLVNVDENNLEGLQPSLSHLCSLETKLLVHALSDTLRTFVQHRLDFKMKNTSVSGSGQ